MISQKERGLRWLDGGNRGEERERVSWVDGRRSAGEG